ncbi:hypothetical protein PZB74_08925 [Porifericola rhodea]|uniref:hypothetical protein n=1 Tax=Porifericola rhodea TaxID=930972 RepID=UPI002665776F|nr:hypothetical protein [Porifericola rhodea]WKN33453.1 hypothetical protein PZB74_08925 [Porifericola rhodea]
METLSRESPQYKRCMELLPLVLDREATTEDVDFFHNHVKHWPEVLDCYEKETAFRLAIKQKLGSLPAPEELLTSIRDRIKQAS